MNSKLKLYSLGIVVETKPENTDIILVTPIEIINIQPSGIIKDKKSKFKGELPEIKTKGLSSEINSTNFTRAKWIPFGISNRITSPDVVAGETVILFKYDEVDEYYWTTIFREPSLRRLEDVMYGFCGIEKGQKPFDKSSSYWFEVSTKDKFIHLHTSDSNKEVTTYDINLNTELGILTIKDKQNNIIKLSSLSGVLDIVTNSTVNVTSPVINLNGNVNINGNLNVSSNINASGSIIDSGGNTPNHTH